MNKIIISGIMSKNSITAPMKNGGNWSRGTIKNTENKKTLFMNWKCFNDYADIEYLDGQEIEIEGQLMFEKYTDKEGKEKSGYSINAFKITIKEKEKEKQKKETSIKNETKVLIDDDDIPF